MKTPKFWYKDNSILKYILLPLTAIWLLGSFYKKKYKKPKKFNVPILCVGNIIAGGSGKTPLAMELAKLFLKKKASAGRVPAERHRFSPQKRPLWACCQESILKKKKQQGICNNIYIYTNRSTCLKVFCDHKLNSWLNKSIFR